MFGVDYNSMEKEGVARDLLKAFDVILRERGMKQFFNPLRYFMFWDKEVRASTVASKFVVASQMKILEQYRSKHTPEEIEKDPSILGHLVRSPYPSDVQRCADMTIFMIAGQDTTSNSMAWVICEVSKNAEISKKIRREIDSIVDKDDVNISTKQLNCMIYLDQVIKESMRMWPVFPLGVVRLASNDIPYKEYVIPKGSLLWLPFYPMFRGNGIEVRLLYVMFG